MRNSVSSQQRCNIFAGIVAMALGGVIIANSEGIGTIPGVVIFGAGIAVTAKSGDLSPLTLGDDEIVLPRNTASFSDFNYADFDRD